MPVSPLAPKIIPEMPVIDGVEFATAATGTKYKGRDDVMLAKLAAGTSVAGVFTRSATRAAPVLDCEAKLGQAAGRKTAAIFVNAGNANAFTGTNGTDAVAAITKAVATATKVPQARVFTASTGVIGEPLPTDGITAALDKMVADLSPEDMAKAAAAIRTTDTFTKVATTTVDLDGTPINIAGIAKGSGMIAPDMATMLVYIFTDAAVAQAPLQRLVGRLTDKTFNAITVDGDTSTSDTLLVAATGKSGAPAINDLRGRNAKTFGDGLHAVMLDLAHQVVRDGEGATKFVEVAVTGAASPSDAKRAAMAIANSPLVKTAIAGEDPNWGRVVMAVGKSGAKADRDQLTIHFGDTLVAEKGWVSPDYTEAAGAAYMKLDNLKITVDLGMGNGVFTAWTCDFTHGYISINADYRS
ncbi:N-acetylglutamate synthase [Actibacterium mucosum KCTC 23349]|uniref:Arginine biosynthesis bifunctional protein ArgJ n=1 Tax=Actibacterium mucosum KCTC 23349 TaxID=1454373 RepID=A0A037ZP14_9RHOB|nr:N-acetylglutamate synthase [Actibacterium mucosum KCTC 23349]